MAASARAMTQPMEWATRWKELKLWCSTRLLSIASTWSFSLYLQLAGLGLWPKPRRSTANNLLLRVEDSRNTVSAQKDDDDVKPCTKMAFSALISSLSVPASSASLQALLFLN